MKDAIKLIFGIIAIMIGIAAIIQLAKNVELIMGSIAITFGVMALIWTWKARKKLSIESSLRKYLTYFLACLIFVLLFSIWSILEKIFLWQETMIYPKYFLISLAYIMFVLSAYKISVIAKEFGFEAEAKEISKLLKKEKKK